MWWELKVWNFGTEGWAILNVLNTIASACHFRNSTIGHNYSPVIHPSGTGFSGLQVRGVVRLFSFLELYEVGELKGMAIVAHVYQGLEQSMRENVWIRPWPTVIIDISKTKLKVKSRGWKDPPIFPQPWLLIYWWRKVIGLDDNDVQAYEHDPV